MINLREAILIPTILIFTVSVGIVTRQSQEAHSETVSLFQEKQSHAISESIQLKINDFLIPPYNFILGLSLSLTEREVDYNSDYEEMKVVLDRFTNGIMPMFDQVGCISISSDQYRMGYRRNADQTLTFINKDPIYSHANDIDYQASQQWFTQNSECLGDDDAGTNSYTSYTYVSATAPIYFEDKLNSVIQVDISLDKLNKYIEEIESQTESSIELLDRDLNTVTKISDFIIDSNIIDNNHKIDLLEGVHHREVIDGKSIYSHLEMLSNNVSPNWYVAISMSEDNMMTDYSKSSSYISIIGFITTVIALLILFIIYRHIYGPILSVANATNKISQGDLSVVVQKKGRIKEIGRLVNAFNEMSTSLNMYLAGIKNKYIYDQLTGLYTQAGFIEEFERLFDDSKRGTLYLIGINSFRDINNSIGHDLGDELLFAITKRLQSFVAEGTLLARIGGDEFLVYSSYHHNKQYSQELAEKFQTAISKPFVIEGHQVVVNISIGILNDLEQLDSDVETIKRNLVKASMALSYAKKTRSGIKNYKHELASDTQFRVDMMARMRVGIENVEFIPYYQPLIALKNKEVVGAEALARWISPTHGCISPIDFIPLAEQCGYINAIGEQVLYQACRDTVKGIAEGKWSDNFVMHINVSVHQLENKHFLDKLMAVISETGVKTRNIGIEITESQIVEDNEIFIENLEGVRALGIKVAIDDFGTGYSSLAYLDKLPFDCIKIDRTFIENLTEDNVDSSIIAAVIKVTKKGVEIVAEGVETQEQANILTDLNCDFAQGFLYKKPAPYEEW